MQLSKKMRGIAPYLMTLGSALLLIGCGSTPIASNKQTQAATSKSGTSAPVLPRAGSGRGGYYQDDGPGDKPPEDLQSLPDADPKIEPYSARGNRPYVVFGKTYTPMTDNNPFKQRGIGSWYGKKFHGQKTSSGELYDMYKMTAAHPTLPIPSYARVTNLANGRQVIVRVNDRGPFHSGRIIDLSYTAALKLGYLGSGSSALEVERLLPEDIARINKEKQNPVVRSEPVPQSATPSPPQSATAARLRIEADPLPSAALVGQADAVLSAGKPASITISPMTPLPTTTANSGNFYLQLGAYAQADNAEAMRAQFQQKWAALPAAGVVQNGSMYRLFCGPFSNKEEAIAAAQMIQEGGNTKPLVVQR